MFMVTGSGGLGFVGVGVLLLAACGGGGGTGMPAGITVEDLELSAFLDSNNDGLCANDAPQTIRLSGWFAENRPGSRIIVLNAAAGWCGPCMQEAAAMNDFAAAYAPRGVTVMTAVFQNNRGEPADLEFTRLWAETFSLSIPTLADSSFATSKYFDVNTMPANLFVDAETKEILTIATGAEPGGDPMKEYRELLDHYLE